MKIAILGYGLQGQSAYEYWQDGNDITICDGKEDLELPSGAKGQLGSSHLEGLDKFDLLVRSPTVHPRDILAANSQEILEKVTSNTNEFMKVCPTKNIVGVTGTKGKGTASTLVTKMLEADGKRVHLGGNIGTPPLDLLKDNIKPDDWVVLELANFQLIDLKSSPHIAVCLMVVPEHMDWHTDMDEYVEAKQQLFKHQKPEDIAVYYADNQISTKVADASPAQKIPYFKKPGAVVENGEIVIDGQGICRIDELKLLGEHNWQNVCASVTVVWQVSQNIEAFRSVVTTFAGLPHRLELVRELDGVKYYNDSFAATPDAAEAAIQAIPGRKIMLMGGFDRQLSFDKLASSVAEASKDIEKVLLIGASAERLSVALKSAGFTNFDIDSSKSMSEIVRRAKDLAQTDETVVLSPGAASFDMFKNFEDRGDQFREAVKAL